MTDIRFVIISPARSGSTALRVALARHPEVTCHGEIFGERRVLSVVPHVTDLPIDPVRQLSMRATNTLDFLERAWRSTRPICGFKILYQQLSSLYAAEVLEYIEQQESVRVILLWREDLCRRFISERKMRTQLARSREAEVRISLPLNLMWQDALNHMAARRRFTGLFGARALHLTYEEIAARRQIPEANRYLDLGEPAVALRDEPEVRPGPKIIVENETELTAYYKKKMAALHAVPAQARTDAEAQPGE